MNKTILVVGVVIFFIVSWLTTFIGELNDEVDVSYGYHEKELITGEQSINSTLSIDENKKIWINSPIKDKMLSLFPRFTEMKEFIEMNLDDSDFKSKLLTHIDTINERYIGGELNPESAKASLVKF